MDDDELMAVLSRAAAAAADALAGNRDWGETGEVAGQYHLDLAADAPAAATLHRAGLGVLSEESGPADLEREVVVVLDPVDGSTNASRAIPWFATSLCAVDEWGPRAAVVVNLATGVRHEAVRGRGARRDGSPVRPRPPVGLSDAIVGVSGLPPAHLGWRQFRALGALALDLCAVADGTLDGFADCGHDAHGPWDYLGGLLVCREAGAVVEDLAGRELVVVDPGARRTPVAGSSPGLVGALRDALGRARAVGGGGPPGNFRKTR